MHFFHAFVLASRLDLRVKNTGEVNSVVVVRMTMHNPSAAKKRFRKKWIAGLRRCSSSSHESMSMSERRRIIKLSADLALASARNGSTRWSRAVICDAFQSRDNKVLVQQILGLDRDDSAGLISGEETFNKNMVAGRTTKKVVILMSKKIVKRSRRAKKSTRRWPRNKAASIAKRLVKKRTQLLKDLVPGGRDMDNVSLIEETLDYMVWLRAQVDVMRSLARSFPTTQTSK